MSGVLPIRGDDLWVKVVEILQQNWAAIGREPFDGVRARYINEAEAVGRLARNGFRHFAGTPDLQPPAPFPADLPPPRPSERPDRLLGQIRAMTEAASGTFVAIDERLPTSPQAIPAAKSD